MAVSHVSISVRNGNVEKALSIFKKTVKHSNILNEYKAKAEFNKPSDVRRKKLKDAKYKEKTERKKYI